MTRLSGGCMIRLHAHHVRKLSLFLSHPVYWRSSLQGGGGGEGANPYDSENAWPSLNHSILSVLEEESNTRRRKIRILSISGSVGVQYWKLKSRGGCWGGSITVSIETHSTVLCTPVLLRWLSQSNWESSHSKYKNKLSSTPLTFSLERTYRNSIRFLTYFHKQEKIYESIRSEPGSPINKKWNISALLHMHQLQLWGQKKIVNQKKTMNDKLPPPPAPSPMTWYCKKSNVAIHSAILRHE